MIDAMHPPDGIRVLEIYAEGIATGDATFETSAPSWEDWDKKHLKKCRIVARDRDEILGWAALSPVSDRCAYGGGAEISVFLAPPPRGKGVGRILLAALVGESEQAGLWTLRAGNFPENPARAAHHLGGGFREGGRR